jgi:D-glycero-alpha-D-manno-heptose-7-phosphate kinase
VALAGALARLRGLRPARPRLIDLAKGVETQAIKVPTGYQDYVAAAYGGASRIVYDAHGAHRTPLAGPRFLAELERHLMLLYTGRPRFSGANNWELFKRHVDGDRRTWRFFEALARNAVDMAHTFATENVAGVARVMQHDWEVRRRMLPGMSTPPIDALIRTLRRQGAWAARLCGAGGGGCLALIVDPGARPRLERLAAHHGARALPCRIHRAGLSVREVRA